MDVTQYLGPVAGLLWATIRADPLLNTVSTWTAGLLAVATMFGILGLIARSKLKTKAKAQTKKEAKELKHMPTARIERFLQWVCPPSDPWVVGDVVVSFQWLAHCIIFGTTGSGKALALDTKVPTPDGWKTMGSIRVGDLVFDDNGRPTRVIAISDIRNDRECHEVVFSDGSTIVADADHQWLTSTHYERISLWHSLRPKKGTGQGQGQEFKQVRPRVRTTKQITATLSRYDGGSNHAVKLAGPLETTHAELTVDPYVFGVWIGDGTTLNGSITTADQEIVDQIAAAGYEVRKQSATMRYGVIGLEHQLRQLGLISGNTYTKTQRGVKRIPIEYLRASRDQRLALLQGLMDTDGYCTKTGTCEFTSTLEHIATATFHLVCSLGFKANLRTKPCKGRTEKTSTAYTVSFTSNVPAFRLTRKLVRQSSEVRATQNQRYIISANRIPSVPVRCISVSAPSHLFLVGEACIPTHNSTFVMQRILRPRLGLPGLVIGILWRFNGHRGFEREKRGCLVFAGNEPKPFRKAVIELQEQGYPAHIWTSDPTGAGFSLDIFEGPPDNVGQRLIAMKPVGQGDTGLQSGAVEGMAVDAIYEMDRLGLTRNPANLLKIIRTVGIRDLDENGEPDMDSPPRELTRQEQTGLENWCTRFSTIRRRLGKSIGPDLKLSEALKNGEVVLIQASSYGQPSSTEQLASMIVYYSMWLVSVIGNFDLIIDEPGAVDAKMFTRLLTATRAQGVRIMICPQSLKQIDSELREMCTTALLLGSAAASHEAQELCSKMVHGDIDPVDFTLLTPRTWRDNLAFWRKRRGIRSCQGFLMSNGRLDFVKTEPCDVSALTKGHKNYDPKRYPIGSVSPLIKARKLAKMQDGPASTRQGKEGPENEGEDEVEGEVEESESAMKDGALVHDGGDSEICDPDDTGSTLDDEDAVSGHVDEQSASDAIQSDVIVSKPTVVVGEIPDVVIPKVAMLTKDGIRIWGKGHAAECRTVQHASVAKLPEGLDVPHRFYGVAGPVDDPKRPKDQCKGLSGEKKGIRGDVTVYRWWYELITGKPISPMKPSTDHLCHTFDDSCPGPNPCSIDGCDDPAHPEGYPCQHIRCYEAKHNLPVTVALNAKCQSEQKSRHAHWLHAQMDKVA